MGSLTHTVGGSDNLVSFKSAARVPIESLKTYFKPKQDLHGYSKPWAPGCGKNLISDNLITNKTINDSGEIIDNPGGRISDYISVSSVSYVWSGTNNYSENWNYRVHGYDENKSWVEQISRTYVYANTSYNIVFTPGSNIKYVRLSFISRAENNQLEQGSTATSYEPYSNICPIEGWNASTNYTAGKNLAHVVGYSAKSTTSPTSIRTTGGSYGNSLSTINYSYPDTPVTITQTQWPNESKINHYSNGYFCVITDNLMFGETYDISFKISNITSNPLNASLSQLTVSSPYGNSRIASEVIGNNIVIFRNIIFSKNNVEPNRTDFAIYNCGMSFTLSEFMVTPANTSDGVFEPYCGDIIPVTFPVTGKNLWNSSFVNSNIDTSTGAIGFNHSNRIASNFVYLNAGTYTFSINESKEVTIYFYTEESSNGFVSAEKLSSWVTAPRTFTINENRYVIFVLRNSDNSAISSNDISQIQLERGSSKTSYEPYSSDNTFYGGYVDVAAGEVVAEYKLRHLDGTEDWLVQDGASGWAPKRIVLLYVEAKDGKYTGAICNKLAPSNNWVPPIYGIVINNNGHLIIGMPEEIQTSQDGKDWLQSIGGIDIIYKLTDPIHYPIPKQQLNTYLNNNSVWTNTNDVTKVSYALHDTGLIRASKRRIAMNQPHVETTTGNSATFNTDMSAAIKSAKVYFEPMQDLHGYDAPWHGGGGVNLFDMSSVTITDDSHITSVVGNDNTITITSNENSTRFSSSNILSWTIPDKIKGANVYIGVSDITHTNSAHKSVIVFQMHDSNDEFISDPTIVLLSSEETRKGRTISIPSNAAYAKIFFRIAQNASTVNVAANDSATFSNFMINYPSTTTTYSPYENICPITGWSGFNSWKAGKNVGRIFGYSATTINTSSDTRSLTNNYGTTINTVDYSAPDTPLIITQSQAPRSDQLSHYSNGYYSIGIDNIIFDRRYNISFKVSNVTSNLLNVDIDDMRLYTPKNSTYSPVKNGDYLIFKNVLFNRNTSTPIRSIFEIRNCGISFTMSEFMVTEVGVEDRTFEPYTGVSMPISFPQQGKNYFNADTTSKTERGMTWTANNDHTITISGTPTDYTYIMTGMFEIPTSGKICLSGLDGVTNIAWDNYYIYNSSKTLLICTGGGGTGYKVVDLDEYDDPRYMILVFKRSSNNVEVSGTIKPQVEIGETPTAYEPYTTTVYSGNVDLVSGVLTIDRKAFTKKISDYNTKTEYNTGINGYRFYKCISEPCIRNSTQLCTTARYAYGAEEHLFDHFYVYTSTTTPAYGTNLLLYLLTPVDETQEFTVVVPLETPITYQLTPQQLKTLRVTNTIWSDANGNVEVKYWKH